MRELSNGKKKKKTDSGCCCCCFFFCLFPHLFLTTPNLNILVVLALTTISRCSDVQVILPETCGHVGALNLSWIKGMVLLGVREEEGLHLDIWDTKDHSPFCEDVGAYLVTKNTSSLSIMMLGNYEDLDQYDSVSFNDNLHGLILCTSYQYGFTSNFPQKTEQSGSPTNVFENVPTVLLPEWPLPLELFAPAAPTLAIVGDSHPLSLSETSSFDFHQKNWDPAPFDRKDNVLPHKLLETLLAQMVLKSVKLSLESEKKEVTEGSEAAAEELSTPSQNQNQHYHPNPHHPTRHSATTASKHGKQFLFSLLQYEKERWHPLINLVNGGKHFGTGGIQGTQGGGEGSSTVTSNGGKDINPNEDYFVTWIHLVFGVVVMGLLILVLSVSALVKRRKARKRNFSSTKHCRKLSRRRVPGTGVTGSKLMLAKDELTFGNVLQETKKGGKSPFSTSFPFQRSASQEIRPDLSKGPLPNGRKQGSPKNDDAGDMSASTALGASGIVARYKGELVHLKKLVPNSSSSFEIKMKGLTVLESIHSLRHENLSALVGFYVGVEGSIAPSLVWEYFNRGSLHHIIKENDAVKLDWAFKLSLLTDLVRGMRYLHSSPVRVHGFLTSHNCVIDSRWVLKITDYGLPAFYYTQGLPLPPRYSKDLLWTAPELLRDESLRGTGTQAGDVYSFAVIMQEVLVRGEPYCMLTLTPEEILEKVKRPPPLIRPSVSKSAAPPEAINIMRQCWAELPDMRPDFMVIHDLFKTLNHGRKANIVDTMFQMLEKYSNNLEELIRERTQQLDLEKKKTEQLLNRMLPNTVAEKLKLGLPVDPEEHSEVTIYFSDIVGFTTISAYSTPFEVVDLLNDLYTSFDGIINDYNVYKVETIGDAYMVVGGAPLYHLDHADQIATMGLDLLSQSGRFKIRHLPFTPLQLRIGIHTGPCCAGVVGLTMPRYCLFGDTVNTASRMESTGAPWRIHISGDTKAKLDEAGGYIIEPRGMTEIKGKGKMLTYWLLGKEGFDKELPTPPGLNECYKLDEKAIRYGRTGILSELASPPKGNVNADIANIGMGDRSNSSIISKPFSPYRLAPPKSPSFAILQTGDICTRSLSPAELIAHQLLNGRPTTRGLRRQLSLDHKAMPVLLKEARLIRRAPSLEENLETSPSLKPAPAVTIQISAEPSTSLPANYFFSEAKSNQVVVVETSLSKGAAGDEPLSSGITVKDLEPNKPERKGGGGKLSKILSVVDECDGSPLLERKYPEASNLNKV